MKLKVKKSNGRARPASKSIAARRRAPLARASGRRQQAGPVEVPADPELVETVGGESTQASMLQLYLREIGRVKLLTPAEEVSLARRVRRGDAQAREEMIKANLRLVVKIAREYDNLGLPLLDLINEGNMGLMKGVERFDPRKGAKLSTYASWWIKQSIKRALANQSKTIRLPVHVVDKVAHLRKAEMRLRDMLQREPTDEELAEEVAIKPRQVREYREAARAPVSLEAPLGDDSDSQAVSEVVADTRAEAPFENLAKTSDAALMREVFMTLSAREQAILSLRFGLNDETPKTLEEIGRQYGVTRERIRQIEGESLKKLRAKMAKRDRPSVLSLAE